MKPLIPKIGDRVVLRKFPDREMFSYAGEMNEHCGKVVTVIDIREYPNTTGLGSATNRKDDQAIFTKVNGYDEPILLAKGWMWSAYGGFEFYREPNTLNRFSDLTEDLL